jgi:hypothetical protein
MIRIYFISSGKKQKSYKAKGMDRDSSEKLGTIC